MTTTKLDTTKLDTRQLDTPQGPRVIVVGLDGSEHSSDALRWAVEEASLRGARVLAVHCWHLSPVIYGYGPLPADIGDSRIAEEKFARASLDEQLETVLGTDPGVRFDRLVREGPAAQRLIEAAHDAELLVVGPRGRGGFAGLLLGSVSTQVAHHARCSVVIVHPAEPKPIPGDALLSRSPSRATPR